METPAMNSDHPKRTGTTLRSFEHSMSLIFAWSVVAAFVVMLLRTHWSFTAWLRELFNVTWPLGLLIGLLSLLGAHAYRRQKDSDGEGPRGVRAIFGALYRFLFWNLGSKRNQFTSRPLPFCWLPSG